jgi:hypothetical protein
MYYSQDNQDKFLEKYIFKEYKNGFFIDINANDGMTYNNTLHFEKYNNWNGINIEPIYDLYKKLIINRSNCINLNCLISNIPYAEMSLEKICDLYNIIYVNYLSINSRGDEFEIIKSINFNKIFIDVIRFETHNINTSYSIIVYLEKFGYKIIEKSLDIFMIHEKSNFI